MPHGSGAASRRADQRRRPPPAADLYSFLHSGTFHANPSIPDCPSASVSGRGEEFAYRLPVGSVQEFGPYRSAHRQHVIDNFLCVLLAELFPWISGIQWLPDPHARHLPGSSLLLFFPESRPSPVNLDCNSTIHFRILMSGLIVPVEGVHGPTSLSPSIFGIAPRRSSPSPVPHPYPTDIVASDLANSVGVYLRPSLLMMNLPDPACVTVKIRGLHRSLHRYGVTSAFLVASGYPPSSFAVLLEFYPPLCVRGRPLSSSEPAPPPLPQDFSALFATVSPPPDDPLMLSASRSWLLPGQPHPVRVSIIPSMARPIAGTPLYPAPPPLRICPQRPLAAPRDILSPFPFFQTAAPAPPQQSSFPASSAFSPTLPRQGPFPPPALHPWAFPPLASFPVPSRPAAAALLSQAELLFSQLSSLLAVCPPPTSPPPGPSSTASALHSLDDTQDPTQGMSALTLAAFTQEMASLSAAVDDSGSPFEFDDPVDDPYDDFVADDCL